MFIGLHLNTYLVESGFSSNSLSFITNILISIIYTLYYVLMHGFFGQTFGKMVVGVKIIDTSETKINFGQSVIRSFPQIIPIIITLGFNSKQLISGMSNQKDIQIADSVQTLLILTIFLWTFFNIIVAVSTDKHHALHDLFAGTVVVKTKV